MLPQLAKPKRRELAAAGILVIFRLADSRYSRLKYRPNLKSETRAAACYLRLAPACRCLPYRPKKHEWI